MICNHQNYREINRIEAVSLNKCDDCGIIFTNKLEEKVDIKALYRKYYPNEMAGRFTFGIELVIRVFRFFRAFKVFTVYPKAKSILDVGSGRGFLLYYLNKYYKYKRTAGIQISKSAYEFSKNKLGLEIYNKELLHLPWDEPSFDIITMWHVLEHVSEPEKHVEKIYELLNKHGKFVVEVPNFNSWTRAITDKYWLGLDLLYHMTFYTPEALSDLLKKYGFKIKSIRTFSLEYSTFISVQSFVSLFTKTDHIFFRCLQAHGFSKWLILHGFLFILITPLCFLINVLLWFSHRGEVLMIIAEKD